MKKPWVVMPLVALLALGGWFVFRPEDEASSAQTTATDQVVEATVGSMAKTVSADGTIAAAESEDLSFGSAGTVTAVNVKAGDQVTVGQVLAEIDSADLEAAVSAAEATVAEAEAKLADDEDADASDEQLTADESSLTSAQDQLDAANEALDGAQLKATIDGTVASVGVTVGEELASGGTGGTDQTGSDSGSGASSGSLPDSGGSSPQGSDDSSSGSSADISLTSTGRFIVDLGFDDTDIANVKVGQSATVAISTSSSSTSGFPGGGMFPGMVVNGNAAAATSGDDTSSDDASSDDAAAQRSAAAASTGGAEGFVSEVGTVADASSGVASYPVTVAFADTSGDYNVGASVTVEITYAEVDDAVQVPSFAVSTATDGSSTVEVKTDNGTETRTVTTGLTSGTMVQITDGLRAGESVVISLPGRGSADSADGGGSGTGTEGGTGGMPAGGPMQGGPAFTQGGGS
jgi:multidrug efflux pump subunit AcrA (membrane-fusion protein)